MRDGNDRPLDRGSAAVLLIDMQESFLAYLSPTTRSQLIMNQKRLLRECAECDTPVIVIEYEGCGSTIAELQQELSLVPRTVTVQKPGADGFRESTLSCELQKLNASQLLFAGVYSGQCVVRTGKSAKRLGYEVATYGSVIADFQEGIIVIWHGLCAEWFKENGRYESGYAGLDIFAT